jgi:hypothetical protein
MTEPALSERARQLLAHYREAESLAVADQVRLLAALEQSLAGGHLGGAGHGGATAKAIAGVGAKVLLGALLVLAPAAWAFRATLVPRAAAPPATVRAPASTAPTSTAVAVVPSPTSAIAAPPLTSAPRMMPGAPAPEPRSASIAPVVGGEHAGGAKLSAARATRAPAPADRSAIAERPLTIEPEMAPAATSVTAAETSPSSVPPSASPLPAPPSVHPAKEGATAKETAPPASPSVDEEVRLLGLAYAQLRAGQALLALATLAEQERRFPDGKLAEPRQVARILALCQAGQRSVARSEGVRFLARHPASPFSNRVRGICGD